LSLDKTEEAEAMIQLPEVKNYRKSLYKRLSQEQAKFNLANPCYVNPGDARTYNEKGVALFNSQNYEEAVAFVLKKQSNLRICKKVLTA
jgi:hypothetical protein